MPGVLQQEWPALADHHHASAQILQALLVLLEEQGALLAILVAFLMGMIPTAQPVSQQDKALAPIQQGLQLILRLLRRLLRAVFS